MDALTALDIIVLLLVCGAAALGFARGFVTEILSLMAWVAAIAAVKLFHEPASQLLVDRVGTEAGASVLAFALVFGIVLLAGRFVGRSIGRRSRQSVLGSFDRVLGLGFGALKGLILATIGFLFVSLVFETVSRGNAPLPEWMTTSRTYPLLRASATALVDLVEQRRAQ